MPLSTMFKLYCRRQFFLLLEETRVPEEKHRPVANQTFSHNVVLSTPCLGEFELTTLVVIGTDCIGNCKSTYHTIMTTMVPTCNLKSDLSTLN